MAEALIALGANLGDARHTIDRAVELLCGEDVRLVARSSYYRTPPWGVTDQPDFVNACIAIETALSPHALLERTQRVERVLGRDRSAAAVQWGPRAIDLDLLAYDDVTLHEDGLTLPHPHLFERAFVLVPLAEIAPDRRIAGKRIADAAQKADATGIVKLPPRLSDLV